MVTPAVSNCRRLGPNNHERPQPWPLLVTFESVGKKEHTIKEQMVKQKDLRNKRRKLLEFKDKKIKIYNGKLWVDGSPTVDAPNATDLDTGQGNACNSRAHNNQKHLDLLKVYMLNIQGFSTSKFNDVIHEIAPMNYDFICFCETWTSSASVKHG